MKHIREIHFFLFCFILLTLLFCLRFFLFPPDISSLNFPTRRAFVEHLNAFELQAESVIASMLHEDYYISSEELLPYSRSDESSIEKEIKALPVDHVISPGGKKA